MQTLLNSQTLAQCPDVTSSAGRYACQLLSSVGAEVDGDIAMAPGADAAADWATSGAMWLTGPEQGPPLLSPAPLASCARGALLALQALTGQSIAGIDGAQLLGERAATAGLQRRGGVSPGGSCRLLATADGMLAVNLARDADWQLLPAWLQGDISGDWDSLTAALQVRPTRALLEQARLLGLAVAPAQGIKPAGRGWYQLAARGRSAQQPRGDAPLVVDLSSLWAGPLCSHLLHILGAQVIKVESLTRPDGARLGPGEFYNLLHAGKASVALPFDNTAGREQLLALLRRADIVIEGSRPRALRQLGIDAEALVAEQPGLTWLSISGYGRASPQAQWVAFGDDAGVAAGLSQALWQESGHWAFCGDAIADPLTGLHTALAAWASWRAGGGHLLELSLHGVSHHCLNSGNLSGLTHALREDGHDWQLLVDGRAYPIVRPRARAARGEAQALGADNETLLSIANATC